MSQVESSTHDDQERRGYAPAVILTLLLLVGLVALPFVPLILSLLEHLTLGTNRVEDFCRDIGIHDALSESTETVFFWLR